MFKGKYFFKQYHLYIYMFFYMKQEFIEDNYHKTMETNKIQETSEDSKSSVPQFDMKDAVDVSTVKPVLTGT